MRGVAQIRKVFRDKRKTLWFTFWLFQRVMNNEFYISKNILLDYMRARIYVCGECGKWVALCMIPCIIRIFGVLIFNSYYSYNILWWRRWRLLYCRRKYCGIECGWNTNYENVQQFFGFPMILSIYTTVELWTEIATILWNYFHFYYS